MSILAGLVTSTCQDVWCEHQIFRALEQSARSFTEEEDEEESDVCEYIIVRSCWRETKVYYTHGSIRHFLC